MAKAPLTETLIRYPGQTLLAFGITLHNTVAYYISLIYIPTWFVKEVKLPPDTALKINTLSLFLFVVLIPFAGALSDRIGRRPLLIASCLGFIVLTYPLFLMASSGALAWCVLMQLVLVVFLALYGGAGPATYAEIFPTRVRYTALSIGYNIAVAVFGGFAPYIATMLVQQTGSNLAPTLYVVAAAVITLVILLRMRETAFSPLE